MNKYKILVRYVVFACFATAMNFFTQEVVFVAVPGGGGALLKHFYRNIGWFGGKVFFR